MRNRFAVTLLVVSVMLALAPPAAAHHKAGPCDFHQEEGETIRHFSKRLIRCAVKDSGPVPGGATRALCIAKRESGLLPWVESATGLYVGLFQHAREYWKGRYAAYTDPAEELPTRMKSGRTNSIVAIRVVRKAGTWHDAGWPVKDCR